MRWIAAFVAVGCGASSSPGQPSPSRAGDRRQTPTARPVISARTFAAPTPAQRSDPPAPDAGAESVDTWPAFADVGAAIGVDAPHGVVLGHFAIGQAFGDFDDDGDLDLFVSGGALGSVLYENTGEGTFAERTDETELKGRATAGAAWGDYDNDGYPDLVVATRGSPALLHNDAGNGFTEVTSHAGIGGRGDSTMAAWGDYDGDGWLDLYVANHNNHPDELFRGSASGRFQRVNHLLGPAGPDPSFAATFTDFNGDGFLDIYTCVDHIRGNVMRRNIGSGCSTTSCFDDVGSAVGAALEINCMGLAIGDYDNDLDLDLYMSDIHQAHLLQSQVSAGNEAFIAVTEDAGVDFGAIGWGTVFFDMDNDGWLDLYLATQNPSIGLANRVFRGSPTGEFEDVSALSGASDAGWTYGVVYGDYDADGFVDLVIGNRGQGYKVYRNLGTVGADNHYITIDLEGGGPINRDALGARVWVTTSSGAVRMAEVRSGSTMGGGNMQALHFGLGPDTVDNVEIRWPDGLVEQVDTVPTDTIWTHAYPG